MKTIILQSKLLLIPIIFSVLLLGFSFNQDAYAATVTAITDEGSWHDDTTWDSGAVPESDDTVIIPSGITVYNDGDLEMGPGDIINIQGGTLATVGGVLLLDQTTININDDGVLDIGDGELLNESGVINIFFGSLISSGGGNISNDGTINVDCEGMILAPIDGNPEIDICVPTVDSDGDGVDDSIDSNPNAFTAVNSGDWINPSTWEGGIVPGDADNKEILTGIDVTIISGTTITNSANLDIFGIDFTNFGSIHNSGNFVNSGTINNGGALYNFDLSFNGGTIDNSGTITNISGTVANFNIGLIDNTEGVLNNSGTIDNSGTTSDIENGGIINNLVSGIIINSADIDNDETLNNSGTINNDGTIVNGGVLNNDCTGIITGTGTLEEEPVTDTCTPPDTIPPVITLLGNNPETVVVDTTYADAGATASDDVDGDVTVNIATTGLPVDTSVIGSSHTVTYDVSDAAGNAAVQVIRTVDVIAAPDTVPPVITLLGNDPETVEVNTTYSDAGATASDDVDGDITVNIVTGGLPIDTSVPASFTVTYDVSDVAGNAAVQVTRTVDVVEPVGKFVEPEFQENLNDRMIHNFEKKIKHWDHRIDKIENRIDKLEVKLERALANGNLEKVARIEANIADKQDKIEILQDLIHVTKISIGAADVAPVPVELQENLLPKSVEKLEEKIAKWEDKIDKLNSRADDLEEKAQAAQEAGKEEKALRLQARADALRDKAEVFEDLNQVLKCAVGLDE